MFLRIKKRTNSSGKSYEYAYLVLNSYKKRKKAPRQKVKKYLGRVYRFEKVLNNEIEAIDIEKKTLKENMSVLLENELKNYGFEAKEGVWQRETCSINLRQGLCHDQKGKNISIAVNDGVMHAATMNALINFKPREGLEKEIGKQLGNALISAGIKPKEAVFIELFRQVMRQLNDDHR